ncbi:riboflavin synthase [Dermabacter hominis]|uniref:riboflavin synthase n=1 Tax=Dermabacter hominis TaxID=36740 RepID=UPI002A43D8A7|nr:riboflavin synthase [Dermabacter hominis]
MFTGIISAKGTVTELEKGADDTARLTLEAPAPLLDGLALGGSLAVNGVCLTAIEKPETHGEEARFTAIAMGETLARTSLGDLAVGSRVNLERCTEVGARLDGHIVQGHVDGVGAVARIDDEGTWRRMRIEIPDNLEEQVAEKGSITLDGVSLTVTAVNTPGESPAFVEVALIPETLEATTLGEATVGTRVNVETDVIAKYTARLVAVRAARKECTK